MNNRVFNALRKVAADKESLPLMDPSLKPYRDAIWSDTNRYTKDRSAPYRMLNYFDALSEISEYKKPGQEPTLGDVRHWLAARNASKISNKSAADPFTLRLQEFLKTYGKAKQFNVDNPDKAKPLPEFEYNKEDVDDPKRFELGLKGAKATQANNRRNNPYYNIG